MLEQRTAAASGHPDQRATGVLAIGRRPGVGHHEQLEPGHREIRGRDMCILGRSALDQLERRLRWCGRSGRRTRGAGGPAPRRRGGCHRRGSRARSGACAGRLRIVRRARRDGEHARRDSGDQAQHAGAPRWRHRPSRQRRTLTVAQLVERGAPTRRRLRFSAPCASETPRDGDHRRCDRHLHVPGQPRGPGLAPSTRTPRTAGMRISRTRPGRSAGWRRRSAAGVEARTRTERGRTPSAGAQR